MRPQTPRFLTMLALASCLSLSLAQAAFAADAIHVWTDESGRIHYSNQPAERAAARTLTAPALPTAEEAAAESRRAAHARDVLTKWQSSRDTVTLVEGNARVPCERALHIVGFLRDYPELPVLRPLDAGQVALMDMHQRTQILQQAQADIQQRCQFVSDIDMNELWTGLFWPRTARAAVVLPTQFLPGPVLQEPLAEIRGGRPRTTPVNPVTAIVNGRAPVAPASPTAGVTGSRSPVAASGAGGVSFR